MPKFRDILVELKPNEPNEFYLEKSKFRYFAIFVKGSRSPLKLSKQI